MTIILVRHGETAGNAALFVQPASTPLNELGLQQAELVAERLSELGVAHILCSDLPRARMTAEPLARRTGLDLELSPLLQERNFGDLRGTPYSELRDGHPFAPDLSPPNGESWPVFHERVLQAFALISARRRASHGNLVVVTHGLVCSSLLERVVPRAEGLALPPRFLNTSVTLLEPAPPHRASLINCVAHLTPQAAPRASGAA